MIRELDPQYLSERLFENARRNRNNMVIFYEAALGIEMLASVPVATYVSRLAYKIMEKHNPSMDPSLQFTLGIGTAALSGAAMVGGILHRARNRHSRRKRDYGLEKRIEELV